MDYIGPMFDIEGEWVTYKSISRVFNTRGDATETPTTSTIPIIVVTSPDPKRSPFKFSDLSDQSIIIYALSSIYEGDLITWKSSDWRLNTVKVVDDEPNGDILYAAICTKEVS